MVKVAGLEPQGPEFEPLPTTDLTPGGVDSAYHPSEIAKCTTGVITIRDNLYRSGNLSRTVLLYCKKGMVVVLVLESSECAEKWLILSRPFKG